MTLHTFIKGPKSSPEPAIAAANYIGSSIFIPPVYVKTHSDDWTDNEGLTKCPRHGVDADNTANALVFSS